ncbi:TIR domain-containing protein [Corynebacterium belfantii]|uniref:TIR domain-containing protein n=1 Tax=Corynebacterium belfantii TaxID=2014537 RepID=UPI0018D30277|nr:TIR domain-containing protein [Corynebacterium belfantii]MBG9320256.1 TIR domain-containing protein [Corynebacterium belfantii]
MAIFYSFHYDNDNWRVQQIRNMGAIDNTGSIGAQEWESVRRNTSAAIKNWIDSQMSYKRAVVVLIGSQTASRDWVKYEIQRAWSLGKPLLGIKIHGLKDQYGHTSIEGENPFSSLGYWQVPVFTPQGWDSQQKYADIKNNLADWITRGYSRT